MSYPRVGKDSPGRVVFLSFPLDCVPFNGAAPDDETTLLRNILNFLLPGANGVGTIQLDQRVYSVPDKVTVEVGDSDLRGKGQLLVTFAANSSTTQTTVTLTESSHPGLFRGSLILVTNNPTSNQLAVRNGDKITATYVDASNNSNVVATASIDTVAPAIAGVQATTDVASATVTWTSSEPADSLVQYGESVLLDRTAYDPALVTNHSVVIGGLAANRLYHYQVVSRDEAGNTATDDNHGALYTFQTHPALTPPWSDDLESGAPGWTVVPDPSGSDMNWTLGTPQNGLESSAHSGTHAWGSDLDGQQFALIASSYLFSPLIDLSGVSQATLSFWDAYDFSSGLEQGQILISTNSNASLSSLPVLADFSGGSAPVWQEESLDLSAYAGKTIQVVWQYQGVSIGSPVNGWLIDDLGISGTAVGSTGTLIISNNLSQAAFTVTGGISQSGGGLTTIISNAPAGQYTIQFQDVSFYQTPPPQTNTLSAKGTVSFRGDYTFIDANRNGISDAWEKYYFGAELTNRTDLTDSDGDGMSDYAEFIAGTDPTNAASKLVFTSAVVQTNSAVQFQWSAVPGRSYQLLSSSNLTTWVPIMGWTQATRSPMAFTATNGVGDRVYRVEVRP